jgi:aminopeptidase N
MKWFVLIIVSLYSFSAFAQQNVCKDLNGIADMERQQMARVQMTSQTSASNNFKINFYRCTWKIDPAIRYIDGKVAAYFTMTAPSTNIVFDLTNMLTVDSVIFRNQKIAFTQSNNLTLTIQFATMLAAGQKDSVITFYHGVPDNSGFGSFIQDTHSSVPVIWTLSEPFGAKDWWPCRNGLDDKADSIDIIIIHPAIYSAKSNGLLTSVTTNGNTNTSYYKHRYPIASYLVALSITNFISYTEYAQLGNISYPVTNNIYPERIADFQPYTHKVTDALTLFHNTFGDYPFIKEKYEQTQFLWGGGMEHQTNSFITTSDELLMSHELGHQWFGDKVTCGSWQDIWLHEGFATFCSMLYVEHFDTTSILPSTNYYLTSIVSQPDGSVWVDDTTSVNRIFSSRLSYYKAAFLLRMLRLTLTDSVFFNGLRSYLQDSALRYGFARTVDLQRHLEQASGRDLKYFFDQWFYGQGYPSFTVNWSQNKNNWADIKVSETTSHPSVSFYKTPLPLTFKNATQQKTIIVQCDVNNGETWADIGFIADTVLVDPNLWVVSANNKTVHHGYTGSLNEIKIYPNPVGNGPLYISLKNPTEQKLSVQLYNVAGQLLYVKTFDTPGGDQLLSIPFASYPRGIYLIKMDADNAIHFAGKIIK